MNKKYLLLAIAILVLAPLAWFLVSPLFITRRVDESLQDLYKMASMPTSLMPQALPMPGQQPAKMMDLSQVTPPAGLDPKTESKGPTMPPPDQNMVEGVGQGTFVGLAGHSAQGRASLIKIGEKFYVRLEDDFRVTNGPDLYVGFGKSGEYAKGSEVAPLKGNEGGQNYEVPASINPLQYNEIWVWCRAFSVPFGKAVISS